MLLMVGIGRVKRIRKNVLLSSDVDAIGIFPKHCALWTNKSKKRSLSVQAHFRRDFWIRELKTRRHVVKF